MSRRSPRDSINEPIAEVPMDVSILESVLRIVRVAVEYDVELTSGTAANIVVALCDISATDALAEYARKGGASEYGLISIIGLPDAPKKPIVWELFEANGVSGVGVTVADGDSDLSAEAYDLCIRTVFWFFEEIPHVAPLLAAKAQELTDAYELGQMIKIDKSTLH